jgi:light-regulated signal transduction histidine kinase (bacteriophytochrome)
MTDGIHDALRYISASTTKLQQLIDALLVLSRTGREQYTMQPLEITRLVQASVTELRQTIDTCGAKVQVAELPDAFGDATALGQVFANLIGNAIKYLKPGRPGEIEVGGEAGEDVSHYWVRDNGSGLGPSAMKRLFQVFARFHPQLAPGEGMGLAIVKRVVERHGGKVWAESSEGAGTTFHFTLPSAQRKRNSWLKTA